uniref:Ig-like domain-containing protein n=1 Tax=Dicentrarchus labrax TaxID=13489 RepID=A0A8P4KQX9_DICLA
RKIIYLQLLLGLYLLLLPLLYLNVAQTSYQAEENNNITLEWTFKTNNDSSNNSLNIFCELIADQKVSVLYDLHEGVEVPESQHEQFAGRVQCDKDVLTEGKIRLHVSKLRTEDSGLYVLRIECLSLIKFKDTVLKFSLLYTRLQENKETMTAVCTTQGFPEPLVKWRLQYLSNNSQHVPDPRDVHTTAVQDNQDHQYRLKSAVDIPEGRYRSVTCLFHNPILNVTVSTTHVLNRGKLKELIVIPLYRKHTLSLDFLSVMTKHKNCKKTNKKPFRMLKKKWKFPLNTRIK